MNGNATCSRCAFFDSHSNAVQKPQNDGLCRFNPPVSQPSAQDHGLWPVVSTGDWCGHFSAETIKTAAE